MMIHTIVWHLQSNLKIMQILHNGNKEQLQELRRVLHIALGIEVAHTSEAIGAIQEQSLYK